MARRADDRKGQGRFAAAATAGLFEISNVHFSGYDKALESFDNTAIDPVVGILSSDQNKTWFKGNGFTDGILLRESYANKFYDAIDGVGLAQPVSTRSGFDPRPGAGSAAVNASYTVPSGFDASGNGFAAPSEPERTGWTDGPTSIRRNTVY